MNEGVNKIDEQLLRPINRASLFLISTLFIFLIFIMSIVSVSATAKISSEIPVWGTPTPIYNSATAYAGNPIVVEDTLGKIHGLWVYIAANGNGDTGIVYSKKNVGQSWMPPQIVPTGIWNPNGQIYLSVDDNNIAHVLRTSSSSNGETVYTNSADGITWTEPITVTNVGEDLIPQVYSNSLYYLGDHLLIRSPTGEWSTEAIPYPDFMASDFEIDGDGNLHMLFHDYVEDEIYYLKRLPDLTWESPINVSNNEENSFDGRLALDDNNNVYIIWADSVTYPCFPITCNGLNLNYRDIVSGSVSDPHFLALLKGSFGILKYDIDVTSDGQVHVVWVSDEDDRKVFTITRKTDLSWETPVSRLGIYATMVAHNNEVHLIWRGSGYKINHQWKQESNGWSSTNLAGCCLQNTYAIGIGDVTSAKLHLLYTAFPAPYTFLVLYNSFDPINAPTPTPTLTSTPTPIPTLTPTLTPTLNYLYLPDVKK